MSMNTFSKRTEIDLNECEHFLTANLDRFEILKCYEMLLFLSSDWLIFCHMIISLINSLGFLFIYFMFLSDEGPTLKTLDFTFHIGSTPTFLYFDLYLYSAYAAHHVYFTSNTLGYATDFVAIR